MSSTSTSSATQVSPNATISPQCLDSIKSTFSTDGIVNDENTAQFSKSSTATDNLPKGKTLNVYKEETKISLTAF